MSEIICILKMLNIEENIWNICILKILNIEENVLKYCNKTWVGVIPVKYGNTHYICTYLAILQCSSLDLGVYIS